MSDSFSVALIFLINNLGVGWIFVISLSFMFVFSAIEFTFTLLNKGGKKLLASHFIFLFSISLGQISFSYFSYEVTIYPFIYAFILLSFGVLLFIPTFLLSKKSNKIKVIPEQKKFIDFLDKKIELEKSSSSEKSFNMVEETISKPPLGAVEILKAVEQKSAKNKEEINFSHVKNIIQKLDSINLSNADIRQVKDLKTNVYLAENGGIDRELKEKINDGLGALLKIMAKYGV